MEEVNKLKALNLNYLNYNRLIFYYLGLSTRARELLNPLNINHCRFVLLKDEKYCEIPCESDLEYQQGNRDGSDNMNYGKNRMRNNRPDSFAVDQDRLVNRKNYDDQDALNSRDQNRQETYGSENNYEQPDTNYDSNTDDNTNYGNNNQYGRNDYNRNEDYRNTNEPSTNGDSYERIPEDCKASDWSEWSSCFGDCSVGKYRNRTRSLTTFESNCLLMPLVEQKSCDEECGGSFGRGRQRTRLMPRNVTPRMPRSRPANRNANAKINDRTQLRSKKDNRSDQRLNARNVVSTRMNSRLDNRKNTNPKNVNKKNENSELLGKR